MSMSLGEAASIFRRDAERYQKLAEAAEVIMQAEQGSSEKIRQLEEIDRKIADAQQTLGEWDRKVSEKVTHCADELKRLEDQFTADKSSVEQDIENRRNALKQQRIQLDKDLDVVADKRRQASEDVREAESAGRVKAEELEAAHQKRMTDLQGIEQDLKASIQDLQSRRQAMLDAARNIPA